MSRCILDSSICVDLSNGGLLEIALRLPHTLLLPDVVVQELKEPVGPDLVGLGYAPISLPGEGMALLSSLVELYRKPSFVDLFALACAKAHLCLLLTGDADLRTASDKEGVEVHGVLWILDGLVAQDLLVGADAANALERIVASGARLPKNECDSRFKAWRG